MEKNLTNGSVFKNVILFSLPYLLSYFLQTLYGMADLFIIGQYDGVASTTAVSAGSQIMHMITVMIVGLAMGTTVSIGQAVGAGDKKQASNSIGNTIILFMAVTIIGMVLLLILVHPIVSIMSTPEAAVNGTVEYLTICFIGIPFITAYNIISSIFRGMGDSKSPMYFIAVACVANIALDYLFMGVLSFGPTGAALGTTISQAISVVVSLFVILKRKCIVLRKSDFKPLRPIMKKILSIGIPIAVQDGLICIFAGIHFGFSGYFCACGKSGLSFMHNILAIAMVRIPGVYMISQMFPTTLFPMGLATAAGSLLSVIICIIAFMLLQRKEPIIEGKR